MRTFDSTKAFDVRYTSNVPLLFFAPVTLKILISFLFSLLSLSFAAPSASLEDNFGPLRS